MREECKKALVKRMEIVFWACSQVCKEILIILDINNIAGGRFAPSARLEIHLVRWRRIPSQNGEGKYFFRLQQIFPVAVSKAENFGSSPM
jgi:hypothetical protein